MAEVIAIATAGRFLSPLITNLILKGCSFFKDDIKGKLQALQAITLPKIKAVIEEAEKRGMQSQALVQWLLELKEAAYDAEDVLDEYHYKLLERQAREKYWKAVSNLFSFASDASFKLKVKSSLENLDRVASGVDAFIQLLGLNNFDTISHSVISIGSNLHVTTSELSEPQVFGRDKEKHDIVNLLISNVHDQLDVLVLPIVGVGGVGKTTLAQYVYNNKKIMDHFHQRMWVHMPQNFDEVRLTRRMIESASGDACPDIDNFDVLQKKLRHYVQHKTFLLVVDDVWYDEKLSEFANKERWRKLFAPLKHCDKGSAILITSRMELVAKMFSGETKQIFLKGLEEEECLSLFDKYAFGVAVEKPDGHLMEIGEKIIKKIVTKLSGLPLAAKVVGGMLRDKLDAEEWNNILKFDVWDDIMRVLTLSYHRLPPHLQQCIAHHGLYEKGFPCRRENLVHSWISLGLVAPSANLRDGMRMEDVGSLYLDELVFISFFQCTYDGLFVLHDLMHDVADSVSRDECVRIVGDKRKEIPLTTRHLTIEIEKLSEYKKFIFQLKNLRTLSFICSPESNSTIDPDDLDGIFKNTKRLRALDFAGCPLDKLPGSIGYLKHLRFLDLSDSSLKALPKTIHKLYHLFHLDLRRCRFDTLPKDLNRMIYLRHLMSDGRTLSMVPHIGRLAALQELDEFHVKKVKGYELLQLKNLEDLRGVLRIVNLQNIGNASEAAEAMLKSKIHLNELSLEWDCFYVQEGKVYHKYESVEPVTCDAMELVIDELQPPQQIASLIIKGYSGKKTPSWMRANLCNPELQTLVLDLCVNWETLPSLGQLFPHLTEIVLRHCLQFHYLPMLPPTLKKLVLHGCVAVSLLTEEELQMMDTSFNGRPLIEDGAVEKSLMENPRVVSALQDFEFFLENVGLLSPDASSSPETLVNYLEGWVMGLKFDAISEKLNRISSDGNNVQQLPCNLQHLHLHDCSVDDFTLSECIKRLNLLNRLELSKCMALTSLPSEETLGELRHLQMLDIEECVLLTSLGGLKNLTSLQQLKINMCPNLMAVVNQSDGAILPESLVELGIRDAGFLDKYLSRCLMGLSRLSRLAIANCMHLTTFPSAEEMDHLTSLKLLDIRDCENLSSVAGLHVLCSVDTLYVQNCPGLLTSIDAAKGLPSVSLIILSNPLLLPVLLSGEGLASVTTLGLISNQNSAFTKEQEEGLEMLTSLEVLTFRNCQSLPCLACNLRSLTRLEILDISNCPNIRNLPSLPTSLDYLNVEGCHPELEQRCQEGCPDWDLIKHIPQRHII